MLASYLLLLQQRRGRGNAIKARQLAALLDCSERTVRHLTREARRAGYAVCADDNGYYLAASNEEYDHLMAQLKARSTDMLETIRELERRWGERRQPVQKRVFA